MPLLVGFMALVVALFALRAYANAPPAILARMIKTGGGFLCLALAALLLLRGRIDFALPLGGLGLWLLGITGWGGSGFRTAGAGGAGVSRVRSAMVEMELDRATGAIRGMVLAGPFEGRALDSLTRAHIMELYRACALDDPEGARLLEVYLDRRFAGWRETGDGQGDAGRGAAPPRRPGSITEDEAYEILGLKKGAAPGDITRAHRDLMKKLHPDHGGTTDLAARVNEAKEVLMRRHHG